MGCNFTLPGQDSSVNRDRRFRTACLVWVADGGGKAPAAKVTLEGRGRVAALLEGIFRAGARIRAHSEVSFRPAEVNREPAILLLVEGRLDTVFVCSVAGGRIGRVHALRNPEKLRHLESSAI